MLPDYPILFLDILDYDKCVFNFLVKNNINTFGSNCICKQKFSFIKYQNLNIASD